jgi:hypothetical protein
MTMEDLSLHVLDIAENSLSAGARHVGITVLESVREDLLTIEIADDGQGMGKAEAQRVTDPFFTTRTTRRVGLGLPLLLAAARAANGKLDIHAAPGKGMRVRATFQLSHIDRKPLGNMAETIVAIVAARPEIDITYRHDRDGESISFSTEEFRSQLGDVPLDTPEALAFIRRYLIQEEQALQHYG